MRRDYAENDQFDVRFCRQNEIEDIFEVTDKLSGETNYWKYPRSMYMTSDEVLDEVVEEAEREDETQNE